MQVFQLEGMLPKIVALLNKLSNETGKIKNKSILIKVQNEKKTLPTCLDYYCSHGIKEFLTNDILIQ